MGIHELVDNLQTFDPQDAGNRDQAEIAAASALALVEAYCRGRHVDKAGVFRPGVEAVVLAVAARLLANPGQVQRRDQAGSFSMHRGEGFGGFTLTEQLVLNRYRKRSV